MRRKLERFGRYLLLDHLVDGGMAKISRARYLGEEVDKVVAIKMVKEKFSRDPAFKAMFMSEIKLTFSLIHPNIAQTYDYGLLKGKLFVAMEFVDGRNLKEIGDRLSELGYSFPVDISLYIISQVCQGLHYAHNYRDNMSGKLLKIIHRDISPHNLMVNFDGAVKVIDFGIAKVDVEKDEEKKEKKLTRRELHNLKKATGEQTQAGTIKGKISYLAPEYIEGEVLDHRYDQFAVGITLWEMICGERLFDGVNHLEILKKIVNCEIPAPSTINPYVSKEVDELVLKSLSRDVNNRYIDMDAFGRALVKVLYSKFPDFNASDAKYFIREIYKQEIASDREKLAEFGSIDLTVYLRDLKRELEGTDAKGTGSKRIVRRKKRR